METGVTMSCDRKVMVVKPAFMYALEMMALTEKQEEELKMLRFSQRRECITGAAQVWSQTLRRKLEDGAARQQEGHRELFLPNCQSNLEKKKTGINVALNTVLII